MNSGDPPVWLSVVMPVHRPDVWLDEALASIPEGQGVAVIIRDSTPEGSARSAIAHHEARLPIDYEYLPDIASWTRKTNLGVEAAKTEYVCTLHQDDLWLENRISTARKMVSENPDAALYITSANLIDKSGEILGKWQPPFDPGRVVTETYLDRLLVQNSIAMPSPVWRRAAHLQAGGMDESLWYTTDWDLWLKLAEQGPVVFEQVPTTAFRIHANSLTMTGKQREMAREMQQIVERYASPNRTLEPLSHVSVRINAALAQASAGKRGALLDALVTLARLGPVNLAKFLRYSRLVERVLPRLRLRLKGVI